MHFHLQRINYPRKHGEHQYNQDKPTRTQPRTRPLNIIEAKTTQSPDVPLLVYILDNGELETIFPFFLGTTAEAASGEKFGLLGKSLPARVVEGLISFGVASFPIVGDKQVQQIV